MESTPIEPTLKQVTARWPFAAMRIFLGIVWAYEFYRQAPWDNAALVIAIFLLAGILTPLSALAGLALTIYVYTMRFSPNAWESWPWLYWLLMLLHFVVAATRAGRGWGADAIISKKYPRWPIW